MTQMKYVAALALGIVLAAAPALGQRLGSTFTYQGRLVEAGGPASGAYDFQFKLYDAASGGTLVAGPLAANAWPVEAGLFTVLLDFGSAPFDGQPRWLEIAVRATGGGHYTVLAPRQPITAAPYAMYALTATVTDADLLDGQHGAFYQNAANLTAGTLADARLSDNVALLDQTQTFSGNDFFTGDVGIGLTAPLHRLHVVSLDPAKNPICAEFTATGAHHTAAVFGRHDNTDTFGYGVEGKGGYIGVKGSVEPSGTSAYYGLNGNVTGGDGSNYGAAGVAADGVANYGVYGSASGAGATNWGLYGYASGGNRNYGVRGYATGIQAENYAVYGSASGVSSTNWAGYFDGRAYFSGNVGIGTDTPDWKLDVVTSVERAATAMSSKSGESYGVVGTQRAGSSYHVLSGAGVWGDSDSGYGVIGLSYSGIGVQGASFDNSGSGIGGSFASYAADGKGVIGSADDGIGVYGESLHGTGVYGETGSADGYGGYFVGRLYCNDYVGFGIVNPTYRLHLPNTANPAGKGYANAWISASSRRWKENIETIPDALDKVQRLRGVVFDWKPEQGGTHDLGFIAEEVSEVVPELAELEADGTATGIKYDRVTALLVEAVKDQQRVIDQQREQLAGLMTQLTEMQKRLAALESKSSPTTPRR